MSDRRQSSPVLQGVVETPEEARLRALGETIEREHAAVVSAAESMLSHAIACGEALLAAKEIVPAGEFGAWLDRQMPMGLRKSMCRHYMRLAALKEHVDHELSITSNIKLLRGMDPISAGTPRVDAEVKEEALRLHATGQFNRAEIARMVGVHKHTIYAWTDPGFAEHKNAMSKKWHREKREAERLERVPELATNTELQRAWRYGEPNRAAIGRAVRRLAQATGKNATVEALLDLAAICSAWANRLGAVGAVSTQEAEAA